MTSRRRRWLQSEISEFIRQYTRKGTRFDPNDRDYDTKMEKIVRRMDPEELDDLIFGRTEAKDDATEHWLRAGRLPGVDFALNDAVTVIRGAHQGRRGTVVDLLATSPEPRYVVELPDGSDIETYESDLERAAGGPL